MLTYEDTGYFQVKVTPKYRDTSVSTFTGRILGSGDLVLGTTAIESGVYRFPIMANAREVDIVIESDSFLPMKIQSAEWEAMYTIRSQRM